MHGYEPNIHKEEDDKKMASSIDDWRSKEGRNDLEILTWWVQHMDKR